jgi:hypothetical protein
MKRIFYLLVLLQSQNCFSQNKSDFENLIYKTASLSTTQIKSTYTNEGWELVNKNFPKLTWNQLNDKDFSEAKYSSPFKTVKVTVKGARTMVTESTIEYNSPDVEHDLFQLLIKNSKILEQRCDIKEGASYYQRVAEVSLKDLKPVRVIYELSAGSAGVSQKLIFNNNINLPKIGSGAINSTWGKKCD